MEEKLSAIVGDINSFDREYKDFKAKNNIKREYISSQMTTLPNPNYIKGVTSASQPEFNTVLILSAVFFYTPKVVKA